MNYKIFLSILLAFLLIISFESEAECRQVAKVKYETHNGWSKLYTVEVIFLTGYELNSATNSYNYSYYSVYAVIFWDQNEASVIKLSTLLLCGSEVNCDCIENSFVDFQGYDQDGDRWNICINNFCF